MSIRNIRKYKKANLYEQLRVGLSELSKTMMKIRQIYYNFQVSTPRKIQICGNCPLTENLLARKRSYFTRW